MYWSILEYKYLAGVDLTVLSELFSGLPVFFRVR